VNECLLNVENQYQDIYKKYYKNLKNTAYPQLSSFSDQECDREEVLLPKEFGTKKWCKIKSRARKFESINNTPNDRKSSKAYRTTTQHRMRSKQPKPKCKNTQNPFSSSTISTKSLFGIRKNTTQNIDLEVSNLKSLNLTMENNGEIKEDRDSISLTKVDDSKKVEFLTVNTKKVLNSKKITPRNLLRRTRIL